MNSDLTASCLLLLGLMVCAGCGDGGVSEGTTKTLRGYSRDLTAPPLKIDGAKISTALQAKKLASKSYADKVLKEIGISAMESTQVVGIIRLGFDMKGFGVRGQKVWDVRIIELTDQAVRGIIWINAKTGAVRFIAGAWEGEGNGNSGKGK